jgi:predicted Zn-dependent protease
MSLLRLTPLFLALSLATGCAVNSATGGADFVVGSESSEIETGREMYEKMVADGALYDDPELQAYVDRIGQRLVEHSDRPDLKFTFSVIDAPDINAFATPGGFVYVNRGLLAYLDNESELAGVLAHEIAHVTARHHARRKSASVTNKVLATTAGVLTGSGAIYDAANMYGAEIISGFGREMELEADGFGAEYMFKTGYDPDALLEVIGVLKDQELYQRIKAKETGKALATYHGLYASHPRNDQRLQTVIAAASELDTGTYIENPEMPGEFKRQVDGIVFGQSVQGKRDEDRYYHNKLNFTFEHPEGWTVASNAQAVVARAADGTASMTITLRRKDPALTPQAQLEGSAAGTLSEGMDLDQSGLDGYSAIATAGAASKRLAVIEYNNLLYLFEGEANDFATTDPALLQIIQSFRPMHPKERQVGEPRYVTYMQVPRGATMETLAASVRIPDAEAQLRLMNGFYPRGEPRTGDWIKVIR